MRKLKWQLNCSISVVYWNTRCSVCHQCGWFGRSIGLQYIEFQHTADNSGLNETSNHVIVFTWINGRFENDSGKCKYNWTWYKITPTNQPRMTYAGRDIGMGWDWTHVQAIKMQPNPIIKPKTKLQQSATTTTPRWEFKFKFS